MTTTESRLAQAARVSLALLRALAARHAGLRMQVAAELIRDEVPHAAVIVATIPPEAEAPSISGIHDPAGEEIPEENWVDSVSLAEDELAIALLYCGPEVAGWERVTDNTWMLALPRP